VFEQDLSAEKFADLLQGMLISSFSDDLKICLPYRVLRSSRAKIAAESFRGPECYRRQNECRIAVLYDSLGSRAIMTA
jgi:hypothetical protein